MTSGHIAVIDIGKTNAKLALVDRETLEEIAVVTRPNTVLPGPPWPHFDVEGHLAFLLDALAQFHAAHGVDAISITTHGASAALLGEDGSLAAPILDYEHPGPDDLADAYNAIRPPFAETGSARLSGGLNVGAQLFWQFQEDPGLKDRVHHLVTYPQYWGFRLTGVTATDVTSLGCHTDLWNPYENGPSILVARLGLTDKLAPTRKPADVLGPLLPEIAAQTGIAPETLVYCGIHDSNASLMPHLLQRTAPYGVVSTGTWVVVMAIGGEDVSLDPARDTLVNVNALGHPVPSARFMGGREHDLLMEGSTAVPTDEDVASALASGAMLMPAVVPETGPFQGRAARWIGEEPPTGTGTRSASIGFYLALVTAQCLALLGHKGPVYVEGPFAKNIPYLQMLAVATGQKVFPMGSATGTSQGAALLVHSPTNALPETTPVVLPSTMAENMATYAEVWRAHLNE